MLTVALKGQGWLPVSGKLTVKWGRELKFAFAAEKMVDPLLQSFTWQKGELVNVEKRQPLLGIWAIKKANWPWNKIYLVDLQLFELL